MKLLALRSIYRLSDYVFQRCYKKSMRAFRLGHAVSNLYTEAHRAYYDAGMMASDTYREIENFSPLTYHRIDDLFQQYIRSFHYDGEPIKMHWGQSQYRSRFQNLIDQLKQNERYDRKSHLGKDHDQSC